MNVCNSPWNLGPFDWLSAAEPTQIPRRRRTLRADQLGSPRLLRILTKKNTASGSTKTGLTSGFRQMVTGYLVPWRLVRTPTPAKGFDRCCSVLLSLLTSWSFQTQRPIALAMTSVADSSSAATITSNILRRILGDTAASADAGFRTGNTRGRARRGFLQVCAVSACERTSAYVRRNAVRARQQPKD